MPKFQQILDRDQRLEYHKFQSSPGHQVLLFSTYLASEVHHTSGCLSLAPQLVILLHTTQEVQAAVGVLHVLNPHVEALGQDAVAEKGAYGNSFYFPL